MDKKQLIERLSGMKLGETATEWGDQTTYVVKTNGGFAVCDNGEEVEVGNPDVAADIVMENVADNNGKVIIRVDTRSYNKRDFVSELMNGCGDWSESSPLQISKHIDEIAMIVDWDGRVLDADRWWDDIAAEVERRIIVALSKTHHDDPKRERLVEQLSQLVEPLCQSPTYNNDGTDEHTRLQDWLNDGDYDGDETAEEIATEWDEASAE